MGILTYILAGVLVGNLVSRWQYSEEQESQDFLATTFLGVIGAVTAGWGWSLLIEQVGVQVFEWSSLMVAAVGAGVTLSVLKLIRS
jgi:uncharacterized membrane protein YeaQ/YmgE (transglycosylase-associated protein family)